MIHAQSAMEKNLYGPTTTLKTLKNIKKHFGFYRFFNVFIHSASRINNYNMAVQLG